MRIAVGLTVGAEMILIPEVKYENEKIFEAMREAKERGKKSAIIVAAEGIGDNRLLATEIEKATEAEVRLSVLGYTQRGGNPSARSRLLDSLFANKAVELIAEQQKSSVVVLQMEK